MNSGVISPEMRAVIEATYSQTLTRAYINSTEKIIMVALAYGADQSAHSTQLHYPEVCYPAQGFQIEEISEGLISTKSKKINTKKLKTHLGKSRPEAVTYWTLIGNRISTSNWDKKIAEVSHGLKGEIPDGMLTRISSIGNNWEDEFALHAEFAEPFLLNCPPKIRERLIGTEA